MISKPHAAGAERSLSQIIAEVDSANGRKRVEPYLSTRPYPHYQPVRGEPDLLLRIAVDGNEALDRFVGRDFMPVEDQR